MAHPYAHAKNFGHRKAASLKLGKLGPGAGAPPDNGPGQPMTSKSPMTPPQGGLGEGIPGMMGPGMKRGGTPKGKAGKARLDKRARGGAMPKRRGLRAPHATINIIKAPQGDGGLPPTAMPAPPPMAPKPPPMGGPPGMPPGMLPPGMGDGPPKPPGMMRRGGNASKGRKGRGQC